MEIKFDPLLTLHAKPSIGDGRLEGTQWKYDHRVLALDPLRYWVRSFLKCDLRPWGFYSMTSDIVRWSKRGTGSEKNLVPPLASGEASLKSCVGEGPRKMLRILCLGGRT